VFKTELDTIGVYALNGTAIGLPTAIRLYTRTPMRAAASPDGTVNFDIALDIDPASKILVIPSNLIATDARGPGARVIGLQTTTTAFDNVREAPTSGYKYDSTAVISLGQTVLIEARGSQDCLRSFIPNIYAKLVVDSIGPGRLLFVRIASDPNCGFRSLVPNEIPKK
jgi:hypothetical protein